MQRNKDEQVVDLQFYANLLQVENTNKLNIITASARDVVLKRPNRTNTSFQKSGDGFMGSLDSQLTLTNK